MTFCWVYNVSDFVTWYYSFLNQSWEHLKWTFPYVGIDCITWIRDVFDYLLAQKQGLGNNWLLIMKGMLGFLLLL